jgi:hypothetical protein
MIINPDGINYLNSAEDELGRVSHIANQTLGYYREHTSARNPPSRNRTACNHDL